MSIRIAIAISALSLVFATSALAWSWTVKLGSEATMEVAVIDGGDALRIGQFNLSGGTWDRFDKVTSPVVDLFGLPVPNPLMVVRPVFHEVPTEEPGDE